MAPRATPVRRNSIGTCTCSAAVRTTRCGRSSRPAGRGRRRGRSAGDETTPLQSTGEGDEETVIVDGGYADFDAVAETPIEIDLSAEPAAPQNAAPVRREERGGRNRGGRGRGGRERGGRDRGGRGGRDRDRESAPAQTEDTDYPTYDNSYAGYYDESAVPEARNALAAADGNVLRISGLTLEAVGHLAFGAGVELHELSALRSDLEDVFFALTAEEAAE